MSRSLKLSLVCGIFASLLACSEVKADLIFNFEGAELDQVILGSELISTDRVTGTIRFDNIDPLAGPQTVSATSFTLSSTVGGTNSFSFDVLDAASDARVTNNGFDFVPDASEPFGLRIEGFALSISGPAYGQAGVEEIIISDFGDQVGIDFDAFDVPSSAALNLGRGNFLAVPEPGLARKFHR